MLIVDTALQKRLDENNPIKVAIIGAGYSGRNIAYQIINFVPAIQVVAIANRTLANARSAMEFAGIDDYQVVSNGGQLQKSIKEKKFAVTDNMQILFENEEIEAIIEASGIVDFGGEMAFKSIQSGKHTVVMNCEMDATVGPVLKHYADKQGVIYTNTDGDEPGVAMNLFRFVKTIGFTPVMAGNLKGFYNRYRTPETQRAFALEHDKDPRMMTSFVDGTKLSMELSVIANGTGFGVNKRGMHGPNIPDIKELLTSFPLDEIKGKGGAVDFIWGAVQNTGAFVVCHNDAPVKMDYMKYLKMGDGPYYVFYTPFHLPHQEIPITVARAVLFNDAAITPKGKPYTDVLTIAKRDLKAGETLDGIGGYTCFSLIENADVSYQGNFLPMGLSEGCVLKHDISKDTAITYDDVQLPKERFADRLRAEQKQLFF